MSSQNSVIETGVDKLICLVRQRGEIPLQEAAKEIGVSTSIIQEWVDFFDGQGVIDIDYRLTTPYIIERNFTKRQAESMIKGLGNQREVFTRKAEVSLKAIEKESAFLRTIKSEFDTLKNEVGIEVESLKEEFNKLNDYQRKEYELHQRANKQKISSKKILGNLDKQIVTSQKAYNKLTQSINKEKNELDNMQSFLLLIEKNIDVMSDKLVNVKSSVEDMERDLAQKSDILRNSMLNVEEIKEVLKEIEIAVEKKKAESKSVLLNERTSQQEVSQIQDLIVNEVRQNSKRIARSKNLTRKVHKFLNKKLFFDNLIDKLNIESSQLENELRTLIGKAKTTKLMLKNGNLNHDINELEKKFEKFNKRKGIFQFELNKVLSYFMNR